MRGYRLYVKLVSGELNADGYKPFTINKENPMSIYFEGDEESASATVADGSQSSAEESAPEVAEESVDESSEEEATA